MVWGQIAAAVGKTALKLGAKEVTKAGVKAGTKAAAKATGKALIKKGGGKALKYIGKQHLAKAERQAVRREELGRGTDRKTLQRGYGSPMDIENV